jgi:hypothetical protein
LPSEPTPQPPVESPPDGNDPAGDAFGATGEPSAAGRPARRASGDFALLAAWIASLVVHVVLFAVMVAIPWMRERSGLPDAPATTATSLRDLPQQTRFSMAQVESPFAHRQEVTQPAERIAPVKQNALRELNAVRKSNIEIVGIGAGGGEFSKYGLRVGSGGAGPQFFGLGGEARAARKIVYVVDRSGSMMGVFQDLRAELKRSIDRLRKSQKYHVIFYSTDPRWSRLPAGWSTPSAPARSGPLHSLTGRCRRG